MSKIVRFSLIWFIFLGLQCHVCFADSPIPKEAGFQLHYSNSVVSLKADQAEIRDILKNLQEKSGILISFADDVQGNITADFQNLDIKSALQNIAPNFAVEYSGEKGEKIQRIIVISSKSNESHSYEADSSANDYSQADSFNNLNFGSSASKSRSVGGVEERLETHSYVEDELVVKFKASLSRGDIDTLNSKIGVTIQSSIPQINYHVLKLPDGLSVAEAIGWYKQQEGIEQVEPNYRIPVNDLPNDPLFGSQWGLHNAGQDGGTADADIDAPEAWAVHQATPEAVVIAIIDTGVDYNHPDIADNIWENADEDPGDGIDNDGNGFIDDRIGWDFVETDNGHPGEDTTIPDNDPMDRQGHGTHVAGIAGAVINNSLGVAGVGDFIKIMVLRAGYKDAEGKGELENADAAKAIIYAADNKAKILNLSWGDTVQSSIIKDAVKHAAKTAIIIAAAGNNSSNSPFYPAAQDVDQVLSVGATDRNDKPSSSSNYGSWVDIFAPGEDVHSLGLNNGYTTKSGTSMSTPLVAGVAAALLSIHVNESSKDIKRRIILSADILNSLTSKSLTGGRLNFHSALKEYFDEYTIAHEFRNSGTPQGWKADDKSWKYTLPFPFPYFGKIYTSVYVDSNGYLDFTSKISTFLNDLDTLSSRVMIAPLWSDLTTNEQNQPEHDIYIYSPDRNSVCIRWQGAKYLQGTQVNVEVVLNRNGQIQFNYGQGNNNLAATVALSGGSKKKTQFSDIDSLTNFNEIGSILFIPKGSTLKSSMSFERDWSLISLPVIPDTLLPQDVFEPVLNHISAIWQFRDGIWEEWRPNGVQEFTELQPNRGYWVSTDGSSQRFNLRGAAGEFAPPELAVGWNLVGYSQLKVLSVTDFIDAFAINITSVWSYYNNKWHYYDPAAPELSDLTEIYPGRSYWVQVQ